MAYKRRIMGGQRFNRDSASTVSPDVMRRIKEKHTQQLEQKKQTQQQHNDNNIGKQH